MNASGIYVPPLIVFPRKIWKSNLWMEHQRAQSQLAIQVVGFRQMCLLNSSIILFTSLSLHAPATWLVPLCSLWTKHHCPNCNYVSTCCQNSWIAQYLRMVKTSFPKPSVTNYQPTLHNISKEERTLIPLLSCLSSLLFSFVFSSLRQHKH